MNSINEIATQNLLDCWSILYRNLAGTMLRERGHDGETVIRKANYLCGVTVGEMERDVHIREGRLINLETFFTAPSVRCPDPRFRAEWQLFGQQEAVFDVITCPIYDKLEETGDQKLMLPFCEEYHHGCISGYTGGAGQCCLSENFIFPGENSCRLGCYFRASNLKADARANSFDGCLSEPVMPPESYTLSENPQKTYGRWAWILLQSYWKECEERYGKESACILSEGLKSAARETAGFLLCRSHCTNRSLDEAYVSENTFWGIEWEENDLKDTGMEQMIRINYSRILRQELGIYHE